MRKFLILPTEDLDGILDRVEVLRLFDLDFFRYFEKLIMSTAISSVVHFSLLFFINCEYVDVHSFHEESLVL
jgi:hypothetical protein